MADSSEGFRQQIAQVFERWASQIQALLWEARPRLRDDVDAARLARFIVATLEGAMLMSRVNRELGALEGIAADLKRFVALHLRDAASPSTTGTTATTVTTGGAPAARTTAVPMA